jgi:hypothetical protein
VVNGTVDGFAFALICCQWHSEAFKLTREDGKAHDRNPDRAYIMV